MSAPLSPIDQAALDSGIPAQVEFAKPVEIDFPREPVFTPAQEQRVRQLIGSAIAGRITAALDPDRSGDD